MRFSEWLEKRYIEWRGDTRKTITEFAEFLDVKQQLLSAWLNGGYKPGAKNISKIGKKYPDVYEVLGIEPPPEFYFRGLPEEVVQVIREAWLNASARMAAKGISRNSPEGRKILSEEFAKSNSKINQR